MVALRRTHWSICCSTLVVGILLLHGRPLHADDKPPIPSGAALDEALKLVKDVYGDEYAKAEKPEEKTTFAKKLLKAAKETNQGTANHYALLRVAWDVATQAGDAKVALQVADAIAGVYEVNVLDAKVATVKTTAGFVRTSPQNTALATVASEVAEEAVAGDHYDSATELTEIAVVAARKARDWQLVKQIVARDKRIKEMAKAHARAQEALATLENDPTNPAANQAAGEYFCFVKRDWTKGIPMLALGSDETLKALAQKELKVARDPKEQVPLGDGWWELAEGSEGEAKLPFVERAAYWYRRALPGLTQLVRIKVDRRLAEIDEATQDGPAKPEKTTTISPSENKKPGTVDFRDFLGRWVIKYDNKTVRIYVIDAKGIVASYYEGRLRGQGRLALYGNDVLLNLGDGKLERLRVDDGTLRVEHFNPGRSYPHRVANTGVGTKSE
ncbi:MAG: hypothetical protein H8E44_24325 [Planctomycetes bacterium]|nr:hypothetical protein [Planctomycetota bacterium]MBL7042816.1 hypothetical protein [Pirellulaceae bacterium]